MFGLHAWDLIIVLLIALVIFGPRKLPEIGGALGKSIREFKKTTSELTDSLHQLTPTGVAEGRKSLPTSAASTAAPAVQQATTEGGASERE